jgi:hypothetical protein
MTTFTLLLDLALFCVVTLAFLLCWTDPQVVLPLYPAVEDVVTDEHVPTDNVGHLVPVLRVHAHTCTETVLLNVYGSPALIPRNEFCQPITLFLLGSSPHRLFKNSNSVHTSPKSLEEIELNRLS